MDLALYDLGSRSFHIQKLHKLHCVTVPFGLLVIFAQIKPATPTFLYISGLLWRSNKIMHTKTPHKQSQRNDTRKCTVRWSGCCRVPLSLLQLEIQRCSLTGALQTSKGHLLWKKKKPGKISKNGTSLKKIRSESPLMAVPARSSFEQ